MEVLLTGATGYVGGRLLRAFEDGGQAVRCLARRPGEVAATRSTTEVVPGDCLDEASLEGAFSGVRAAYYLVHSMGAGRHFAELDRQAASNFGRAAARAGVQRIIYLGGLSDDVGSLSKHLRSRAETGDVLRASGVPVIEFRASIVIGAGSLSFEIVRALVERLPVMICPRWVETQAQPIAIGDVVAYLHAALDVPVDRRADLRDRRSRSRVVRRHHAALCTAAWLAPTAAAGARSDAAPLGDVAGAGHAGAGQGRPRAGGRAPEQVGGALLRRARRVRDRADAARRGTQHGHR